jgi:hypothetical protein
VPPTPPALELARRLRQLRLEEWPESRLTQGTLAKAIGGDDSLSPATVASWENRSAPKLPPRDRVLAYAQFFATRRSLEPEPHLVRVDGFTEDETATYEDLRDELLELHAAARGTPEAQPVARRSWLFIDPGPLTLVCAQLPEAERGRLANPNDLNYTELLSYADGTSMVELHGHIRAENPEMDVFFKSSPEVKADDLSGHVVIIGGIGWNEVTRRILELTRLPVTQEEDPAITSGEVFVANIAGKVHKYLPRLSRESEDSPAKLLEDVGLLVRMPNPLNSNRTLTMCNGIHSRGVYGAVRSLTDKRLRESNERYISKYFPDNQEFGILMRVQVIEGRAMTPDFSIAGTVLYQWPAEGGNDKPAARTRARA